MENGYIHQTQLNILVCGLIDSCIGKRIELDQVNNIVVKLN